MSHHRLPAQRKPKSDFNRNALDNILANINGDWCGSRETDAKNKSACWSFKALPLNSREFRQEPAVMIADGMAEAQVAVSSARMGEAINCFFIRGGQVTSVRKGEAGEWLMTIVPRQGALEVTVTVQTEQHVIEYPLTVAPPLGLFDATSAGPGMAEFVKTANRLARSTELKKN